MKHHFINAIIFVGILAFCYASMAASNNIPKLRLRARLRYWRMIKYSCFAAVQCDENGKSLAERRAAMKAIVY